MTNGNRKLTMTVEDMAAALGISRPSAYSLVHSGDIPAIRIGQRRIVIPIKALEEMLEATDKLKEENLAKRQTELNQYLHEGESSASLEELQRRERDAKLEANTSLTPEQRAKMRKGNALDDAWRKQRHDKRYGKPK